MKSEADAVFSPGDELLGKYRIERMLGRGGMGEVYLARNQFLDQPVAIKVLPLRRSGEDHWKERMRREAQAGARLAHDNLVRVVDGGVTDDNVVYIVMEYLDGAKTLRELVWKSRGFDHGDALAYAIQLLDGLAAVHAAGILHRDLKPENVVVLPGGLLKIIDFGLAKIRSSAMRTTVVPAGMRVGTLHYMAPEQIFGNDAGPPADVYAAGLILHEMIAGRHVFQQETDVLPSVQEVSIMHQLAQPRRLDGGGARVPKELADVVERMLAKEPAARPTALEAGAALERVLAAVSQGAPAPAQVGVHGTMMLPEGFVPPHPLGPFAPSDAKVTLCARAMERALGGAPPGVTPAGMAGMAGASGASGAPGAGAVDRRNMPDLPSGATPSPITSSISPRTSSRAGPVVAGVLCGTAVVALALAGVVHLRRERSASAAPALSAPASPGSTRAEGGDAASSAPSPDDGADHAVAPAPASPSASAQAVAGAPSASAPAAASASASPQPAASSLPGLAGDAPRPASRPAPGSGPPGPPRSGMPGSGL